MSISRTGWLFCLLSAMAVARDPFAPLIATHCDSQMALLKQWRIEGIIGRAANYRAWLITPQGKRVTAGTGEFLLYPWKVTRIHWSGISVQAIQGCEHQHYRIPLTGSLNAFNQYDVTHLLQLQQQSHRSTSLSGVR